MKQRFLLILALLSLFCLALTEAELTLRADQLEVSSFPEVSLTFSAWDETGLPLSDLFTRDITLKENNGTSFHPDSITLNKDAPLAVALVLDISGSMQGQHLVDA